MFFAKCNATLFKSPPFRKITESFTVKFWNIFLKCHTSENDSYRILTIDKSIFLWNTFLAIFYIFTVQGWIFVFISLQAQGKGFKNLAFWGRGFRAQNKNEWFPFRNVEISVAVSTFVKKKDKQSWFPADFYKLA